MHNQACKRVSLLWYSGGAFLLSLLLQDALLLLLVSYSFASHGLWFNGFTVVDTLDWRWKSSTYIKKKWNKTN